MTTPAATYSDALPVLRDTWALDRAAREDLLLRAVTQAHAYHFERNTAYRSTVAARGVGPSIAPDDMPRLLRSTSLAFRSYVDVLGTPFPQDRPGAFAEWLTEQMSLDAPAGRARFDSDVRSLATLLKTIERAYNAVGLEVLMSDGSSGRAALVPRDKSSADLAVESFSLSLRRYLHVTADHAAIILLPKRTRIAAARMLRMGLQRAGVPRDRTLIAPSLPASPDQARVCTGRAYRAGWRGVVEKYLSRPAVALAQDRLIDPRAFETAVSRLIPAGAHGEPVLLAGSPGRLHGLARFVLGTGHPVMLTPGSLLVTIGRPDESSAAAPAEMRRDLQKAFRLSTDEPAPVHDVYCMTEAGWAAMQCARGNYHVPPWVYAVTLDDQDRFQEKPRSTGLLAFFDPLGGGDLFPAFFRTPDRVTLAKGGGCPCGEAGDYLENGSISRADRGGPDR